METNASSGKVGSDAVGASSEKADGQKDLAFKYHPTDDSRALDRHTTSQYVAVKICISDTTIKSHKKRITQKLLHSEDDRASMVLPILDEFVLDGPNGQYTCLVTPPARMSIAAAKPATTGYNMFPLPTGRAIAAQLTQVVVHGDLHTGNVLLRFASDDSINSLPKSAFYERFGDPYQEPVELVDGVDVKQPAHDPSVPTHGVAPAFLGCRPQEVTLAESAVLLSDFGESYMTSTSDMQRTYCNAPLPVTPPEAHFAAGELGFPADIWALACVIGEVVGGSGSLFGTGFFADDDTLREDWVHVLGKLPDAWRVSRDGAFRRDLFAEDRSVMPDRRDHSIGRDLGLESRFEMMLQEPRCEEKLEIFLGDDKLALMEMLRAMLVYRPGDRIDAQDLLCTEWMMRRGLPSMDDMKRLRN